MIDVSDAEYKAWVERLVHTCIPFELEKKLAYGQPLTRAEAATYANVVHLTSEVKRARNHGKTLARLDEIEAEIKRQGHLTRSEFRKVGEERDKRDKRSAGQRACIDKAVQLYILLHDINRSKAASFQMCCNRYWTQAMQHFTTPGQYRSSVIYDYHNFYDLAALTDLIKTGEITPQALSV